MNIIEFILLFIFSNYFIRESIKINDDKKNKIIKNYVNEQYTNMTIDIMKKLLFNEKYINTTFYDFGCIPLTDDIFNKTVRIYEENLKDIIINNCYNHNLAINNYKKYGYEFIIENPQYIKLHYYYDFYNNEISNEDINNQIINKIIKTYDNITIILEYDKCCYKYIFIL